MAVETFSWCPKVASQVDTSFRTRKAQFGDGYTQVAGDGINPVTPQWSVSFTGDEAYIQAIKNFLNRHTGWKSFIWKPPLEPSGLWRAESFQISTHGNKNTPQQHIHTGIPSMSISSDVQKLEPGKRVRLIEVDGSAFGAGILRFHNETIPIPRRKSSPQAATSQNLSRSRCGGRGRSMARGRMN